jgi:hypothetical protein
MPGIVRLPEYLQADGFSVFKIGSTDHRMRQHSQVRNGVFHGQTIRQWQRPPVAAEDQGGV